MQRKSEIVQIAGEEYLRSIVVDEFGNESRELTLIKPAEQADKSAGYFPTFRATLELARRAAMFFV